MPLSSNRYTRHETVQHRNKMNSSFTKSQVLPESTPRFPKSSVDFFCDLSEDLLGLCSAALKLTAWKTWWVAGSIKLFYH